MLFTSRASRAGLARLAQTSITALATALASFSACAGAQEAEPTNAGGDRTFEAAEFARFAPQTALHMLNQVPGFTIRQASVERGLGQATGNVLLNGQRISNKSDDILAQLRRIPAESVFRIEMRDGATLGIPASQAKSPTSLRAMSACAGNGPIVQNSARSSPNPCSRALRLPSAASVARSNTRSASRTNPATVAPAGQRASSMQGKQ